MALDPDTGRLQWHFQFTPHDIHDWDANQVPVLADLTIGGQARKVVMMANRNGFFYVLDRATGKLLLAKPFGEQTWAREVGVDGRPIVLNETGVEECIPDSHGSTNFMPPSYDPDRGLFFVTVRETCAAYFPIKQEIKPGFSSTSGGVRRMSENTYGALRAIDPKTGDADSCRRDVDCVGPRLRGRQRREFHGIRCANRKTPLALSDRILHLGCGPDDLHVGRPPVRPHRGRQHARRVWVATGVGLSSRPAGCAIQSANAETSMAQRVTLTVTFS